ncbi:glycoside hydrolase family 47 protein [Botryobasidium botryosum FD-172 SS1]|uniref:alpha-1,2-Mannosidase n=1 Tax=Botryobasidium botryosum (strain FD-172 SS1) TaxID=930990 RepID=A0A067MCA4_BOTB1|nr:glycoside hydrolase family 47 protein [Botryobasidium botryosum FD-172 SS1]
MKSASYSAAILLALTKVVLCGNVQLPSAKLAPNLELAQEVKDLFVSVYGDYKKYAFPHDDLLPVSASWTDSRNGWGATVVDSLSTMLLMGLDDLYADALNFTAKIDFSKSKTSSTVSVFETTIRYLGGTLSAYELGGKKDAILIEKAKQVADKMAVAWVGKNEIPYGFVNFSTNKPTIATSNIAEAGTLALEWATLAKYTGNSTYRALAEKALKRIGDNAAPLPGLSVQGIDPSNGNPVGDYILAVDSSIRYLAKNSSVGNHLYLTDYTGGRNRYVSSNLACFHGGNWIMGGKLLDNSTIVDYGLRLADACFNTYSQTATGIGPEVFAYVGSDGGTYTGAGLSTSDLNFYNQVGFYHGFYVYPGGYGYWDMRPEVLESNFYAWRATGDIKYQQRAAAALKSIKTYAKARAGYGGIQNILDAKSSVMDHTESFFLAETLKYLYLTFADPELANLDKWVFNTEAHPLEAPPVSSAFSAAQSPWLPRQLVDFVNQA